MSSAGSRTRRSRRRRRSYPSLHLLRPGQADTRVRGVFRQAVRYQRYTYRQRATRRTRDYITDLLEPAQAFNKVRAESDCGDTKRLEAVRDIGDVMARRVDEPVDAGCVVCHSCVDLKVSTTMPIPQYRRHVVQY
jgi:hypothetical protein